MTKHLNVRKRSGRERPRRVISFIKRGTSNPISASSPLWFETRQGTLGHLPPGFARFALTTLAWLSVAYRLEQRTLRHTPNSGYLREEKSLDLL